MLPFWKRVIALGAASTHCGRLGRHSLLSSVLNLFWQTAWIFDLIEPAGLTLYDVAERHWFLVSGRLLQSGSFWSKIDAIMDRMKRTPGDLTLKEFLATLPDDEQSRRIKAIVSRYVQDFHAGLIDRMGTQGLNLVNEASDEVDGERAFRLLDGYDQVTDWLSAEATRHGAVLHLCAVVKEIDWETGRVSALVAMDDLRTFAAARCLITLPLGVLQARPEDPAAVRFQPHLPERIERAISQLAMGNVVKVNLQFRTRFWEELELPTAERISDLKSQIVDLAPGAERQSLEEFSFIHSFKAPFPTWWTMLPRVSH